MGCDNACFLLLYLYSFLILVLLYNRSITWCYCWRKIGHAVIRCVQDVSNSPLSSYKGRQSDSKEEAVKVGQVQRHMATVTDLILEERLKGVLFRAVSIVHCPLFKCQKKAKHPCLNIRILHKNIAQKRWCLFRS